jgi:hypothetical protein
MHIFARQPIRRGDQNGIEGRLGRLIPEVIEPWAIETGTTIAVITLDMRLGEAPTVLLDQAAQASELLVDRLRLRLAGGRHPRIDCDTH